MYLQQQSRVPAVSTATLLGSVLGITGVGFVITAIAAYLFRDIAPMLGLGALILGFILIFAMSAVRANPRAALLMFYAFTFLEGVGLAPTIARYVATIGSQAVVDAAATTGLGMLVLGLAVYTFSFDFRKLSAIAFGALIALVIVGLISIFVNFIHPGVYAWLTLAVFTLLTLVDFGRIRAGGSGSTAVELAVAIYLDSINIFLALLSIFSGRSRDR